MNIASMVSTLRAKGVIPEKHSDELAAAALTHVEKNTKDGWLYDLVQNFLSGDDRAGHTLADWYAAAAMLPSLEKAGFKNIPVGTLKSVLRRVTVQVFADTLRKYRSTKDAHARADLSTWLVATATDPNRDTDASPQSDAHGPTPPASTPPGGIAAQAPGAAPARAAASAAAGTPTFQTDVPPPRSAQGAARPAPAAPAAVPAGPMPQRSSPTAGNTPERASAPRQAQASAGANGSERVVPLRAGHAPPRAADAPGSGGRQARDEWGNARAERNTPQGGDAERPEYDQVIVYGNAGGKGVGAKFELCPAHDRFIKRHGALKTINVSLANSIGTSTQEGIDWQNRIMVMMSPTEVVGMTAVLLGHLKSFRGAGHGEDQKKWFEFSASTNPRFLGRYLFTVNDGKQARKVSITYADVALLTALFIRGSCAVLKLNEGSALRSVARMAESYGYAVPAHAMGSTPGAPDAPAGAPDAAPPALLGRTSRGHGAPAAAHG